MKNTPEIQQLLKNLKLSGMLETLTVRNEQAVESQLLYPEYLGLLLQDEQLRRDNNQFNRRFKRSNLKGDKTLENFDFCFNPKINQAKVKALATCQFMQEKVSVLLVGQTGTGKTHLAQAIGHSALRQAKDVIFLTPTQLFNELQTARAKGDYLKRYRLLVTVPLLIIDDFALKPMKPQQEEDLHDVIAGRYEEVSTLITSNLDVDEWESVFGNRVLGAATFDRLRHGAHNLTLTGTSYRTQTRSIDENKNKEGVIINQT